MANLEEQARSIFLAALERPAEQWAAHVAEACGDHVALRQRVDQLLQAHQALGSIHGRGDDPAVTASEIPFSDPIGTVIGPYKLLECIGEGGFGVVYLAEQTQPVRRKVALKILKPGMDSRQIVARFEAERQALAIMDHPHIAKVFDGGVTNFGRPYFVMELVKGVPITEYCDKNQLTPRERLELFITVCQAIQHAHQKGVIHRDVKPSNVLVSRHDTTPVVKVIDFGVAKAVGQELTDKTLFTGVAQMIGTPLYMSPEQAGMSDLDVDTRSDIYSLGVLLYELLTGTTPFTKEQFKAAAYDEIRRIIREVEPPTPSTRLSSSDSIGSIAAQRHMEPAKLSKLVRGELDWITMKALEKDRTRRYETANGLARDIQRYLSDEPVEACPPSALYRLRKLGRKHRVVLSTVALIVMLLVVGVGMSLWQMFRAIDAETQAKANEATANAERDAKVKALAAEIAERERATKAEAAAISERDAKVKALAAEIAERQRATRAEAAAISERDAKVKALAAEIAERERATKAEAVAKSERDAKIKALAAETKARERALAALRSMTDKVVERQIAAGRGHTLTAEDRAFMRGIIAQYEAFASLQRNDIDGRALRAEGHARVGIMRHRLGELKAAEQNYTAAVNLLKKLVSDDPDHAGFRHELSQCYNNRAKLWSATGRLKEAEQDYSVALDLNIQLATAYPKHLEFRQSLARNCYNLGSLLHDLGRLKEAERNITAALSLHKKLVNDFPNNPENLWNLATDYNTLGVLHATWNRVKEAEQEFTAALALHKKLAADFPNRPEYRQSQAISHDNRGRLWGMTGSLKKAEQEFTAALALHKQLAADFPNRPEYRLSLAGSHFNVGALQGRVGRLKEAETNYAVALVLYEQLVADFPNRPEYRRDLAQSHNSRALMLREVGRLKEAERDHMAALKLLRQLVIDIPDLTDTRNDLAATCAMLAQLQVRKKNWTEAKKLLLEGQPHHLAVLRNSPKNPTFRQIYHNYLAVLTKVHAGLLEKDEAVRAAETRRDLGWNAPVDAYDAACCYSRCIPIVATHDKLNADQRKVAVRFYTDATMKLLREAVRKGYKDADHIRRDTDFAPLRQLPEFQKLLADLKATAK